MNSPQDQEATLAAASPGDAEFLAMLGHRVRESRARRGMSRKVLARNAGVSERYLAQLESAETNASVILLRHVARALGTTLNELIETRQESVEQRLIQRFLERLPAHRLEDVVLRLMRDFGYEEATRRRRIALVGLRGAGKATLGQALARELNLPFVDLNAEIASEAGMGLDEILMLYGQPGFRRIERRTIEKLINRHDRVIISAGGGIFSAGEAFKLLLLNCYTVWIRATPEEHLARVVAQVGLPPVDSGAEAIDDLRRTLQSHEPLYSKADFTLDTTQRNPDECLRQLRQAINA